MCIFCPTGGEDARLGGLHARQDRHVKESRGDFITIIALKTNDGGDFIIDVVLIFTKEVILSVFQH